MTLPLMPKATAVWLVENSTLTFDQISSFCGMHPLEVQGIADGDVANNVVGQSPISNGQITAEMLQGSEKDSSISLVLKEDFDRYIVEHRKKNKSRYTPVARRQDKPDAIAWLIKSHPTITNSQISKLIGTTKNTIVAIREKTHWTIQNIKPRDPVLLGLCTQTALHAVIAKLEKAKELDTEKAKKVE